MIAAGGGGSPAPASKNTPKSEESTKTSVSHGRDAQLQSSGERSPGNKSAIEETEEGTKDDVIPLTEASTETMEAQSGLSNQEAAPEPDNVADSNIHTSSKDEIGSPLVSTEATTATTSTPVDLTDDNDEEAANPSSTTTTSGRSTPERQLAQLKLDDEKFRTPERSTPKATPHSLENTTRKTRGDAKREKLESEKKNRCNLVPLTAEWEEKVRHTLRHGHGEYQSTDFARVVPPTTNNNGTAAWLNDEVINGYLGLVVKHGRADDRPTQTPSYHNFSTFFYNTLVQKGYEGIKRWANRAKIGGKSLLEVQSVFIPINSGAHWTLLVVSGKDRSATHYNSMSGTATSTSLPSRSGLRASSAPTTTRRSGRSKSRAKAQSSPTWTTAACSPSRPPGRSCWA
ncbi:hypothetical protein AYO21_00632 [Fonsecaea monophora]|uniref:Ubiquitin-like protease family profile domain-containing protein n=1 Tax=Fonsecaea monophora TaxID=254056 RepID=A0A177FLS4_9EURO|nr:hypothetical protein AYO21_00632 [Fonsecaea monophora]OAG45284.1 hypothetical protein AYO21_00632 [Fonsecaea monophora]